MNQPAPRESLPPPLFDTLAVVGVGLLGGSVARAAKQRGLVRRVIGVGRNLARLESTRVAGVIDAAETSLTHAASQADSTKSTFPAQEFLRFERPAFYDSVP